MTAGVVAALLVVVGAVWTRVVPAWRAHRSTWARLAAVTDHPASRAATVPAAPVGLVGLVRSLVVPADGDASGRVRLAAAWRVWVVALVVAAAVAVVTAGFTAGVLVLGSGVAGPPLVARWREARQDRRLDEQLPTFLDAVASALRAGSSLSAGVLEAAERAPSPLRHRLRPVVAGVRAGAPLEAELDAWRERQGSPAVAVVVAALALGLGSGGPQADTVDAIGDTLRDRLAVAGEVRALASQARASAVVIVVAPLVFAVVAAPADAAVLRFLVGSPAGLACLVGGGVLDACGAAWMRSITQGDR